MGTHVVIVEDDVELAALAAQRLKRALTAEVLSFQQGLPALVHLQERPGADLVCLDLSLPDVNGFEICGALRSAPRTAVLPILLMSSRTGVDDYARAHELGINAFLGKPFAMRTLVRVAQQLLDAQRKLSL